MLEWSRCPLWFCSVGHRRLSALPPLLGCFPDVDGASRFDRSTCLVLGMPIENDLDLFGFVQLVDGGFKVLPHHILDLL